jgi:acetylornithine deacetylase/succinyl-diaminopimelate desuccinylase-like protein
MKLTPEQIKSLEDETVQLCQELIQIPSVNFGEGQGNESEIAHYVAEKLREVGINFELIESAPNRVNVVARIEGSDESRDGLVLHGHLDVVPVNADDWSVDPFSGLIKDGFIWGRGAVDMKDMDAMMLACVRMWQRIGYKPPRNILLIFFADEEASGTFGSRWLVKNRPEIFKGYTEAISEVGGFSLTLTNGQRLYLIESAQKGIQWLKITSKGTAGHGSFINTDNPITKLSDVVSRIGNYEWPVIMTDTNIVLFKKLAELTGESYDQSQVKSLLRHLGPASKMIGATLSNTANPTMLEAGYKANVIPQSASAVIDGRFLPGYEQQLVDTIKKIAGNDMEFEVLTRDIALESKFSGGIVEAMCQALYSQDKEAIPVPYLMSGGTDNKALSDLGIVGYGFSPLLLPNDLDFFSLFHGVDERVPVDGLKFGVKVLQEFLENI